MNLSFIKNLTATLIISILTLTGMKTSAQTYRLPGQHTKQSENLLAKQNSVKSNALINDLYKDEPAPEGDIYELGWNSNRVNCYANVDVPQEVVIDVRGAAMPHEGYLTSPYGYRPRFKRMHRGVDIKINMKDPIKAAFSGRIRITNYEAKGYGNYVVIRHHNGLETVYGHLDKILVKNGQDVKAGDVIGLGGNTGRSTGPHLHFETRYMGYAINPAAIFDFPNQTTHTDTYTFNKNTYEQARNYSPEANSAYAAKYNKMRANNNKSNSNATLPTAANNSKNTAAAKESEPAKETTTKTTASTQVPKKPEVKKDSKPEVPKNKFATVREGDSLTRIANRHNTTVDRLCQLNNLTTKSKLTNGQKLRIL